MNCVLVNSAGVVNVQMYPEYIVWMIVKAEIENKIRESRKVN